MKKITILSFLAIILSACATTSTRVLSEKRIKKNSLLIGIIESTPSVSSKPGDDPTDPPPRKHDIVVYKAKGDSRASITEKETSIEIIPTDLKSEFAKDTIKIDVDFDYETPPSKLHIASKYYHFQKLKEANMKLKTQDSLDNNKLNEIYDERRVERIFFKAGKLEYSDNGSFYQTLTIPFKLRKGKDGKPRDLSTAFNAGFAFGHKWNTYKVEPIFDFANGKMVGYDKSSFTYALAPFVGLISIGLTSENTNETVTTDKNVFGVSVGGTAILGLGKFNIGLAGGWDFGLEDSKDWDHQGQPWLGLVLGLDIIK